MIGLLFVIADVILVGLGWRFIATRRINAASARAAAGTHHPANQPVPAVTMEAAEITTPGTAAVGTIAVGVPGEPTPRFGDEYIGEPTVEMVATAAAEAEAEEAVQDAEPPLEVASEVEPVEIVEEPSVASMAPETPPHVDAETQPEPEVEPSVEPPLETLETPREDAPPPTPEPVATATPEEPPPTMAARIETLRAQSDEWARLLDDADRALAAAAAAPPISAS